MAESEFDGILAWAVGQALGADPDNVRARVAAKMGDNIEPADLIGCKTGESDKPSQESKRDINNDDDETIQTVPWPTLSDAALAGIPGEIVNLVESHTEADPAAILAQLLVVFGVTLGSRPHIKVDNERHQGIVHPLIVGRTNNGAKGTSLGVVG